MGNLAFPDWLNDEVVNKRGWTFGELGRRADISSGQISKVMTSSLMPSWNFCLKISQALQIPPTEVFRQAGLLPMRANIGAYDEETRQDVELIAEILSRLSPERRRRMALELVHIARLVEELEQGLVQAPARSEAEVER